MFKHNHIYLIKDTINYFSRLDITGTEYRLMAVPGDCWQPCHIDKEMVKQLLQRRNCAECLFEGCQFRKSPPNKELYDFEDNAGNSKESGDGVGKKKSKKIMSFLFNKLFP